MTHYMSIDHTASRDDHAQPIAKLSFCCFKSFLLEEKLTPPPHHQPPQGRCLEEE